MRRIATTVRPSSVSSANAPSAAEASTRSSSSAADSVTWAPMTWPPSKPISILIRSVLAIGNNLREDAVDGGGVDEGNFQAEEAVARTFVDQLRAVRGELAERRADVV